MPHRHRPLMRPQHPLRLEEHLPSPHRCRQGPKQRGRAALLRPALPHRVRLLPGHHCRQQLWQRRLRRLHKLPLRLRWQHQARGQERGGHRHAQPLHCPLYVFARRGLPPSAPGRRGAAPRERRPKPRTHGLWRRAKRRGGGGGGAAVVPRPDGAREARCQRSEGGLAGEGDGGAVWRAQGAWGGLLGGDVASRLPGGALPHL
mmetsp:Transcript_3488/g.8977  ORF Transcript_3488/g.8977 Transcript_3488/m.8977 type:complete len:203 (+) Transcript_3488:1621-2229(+)